VGHHRGHCASTDSAIGCCRMTHCEKGASAVEFALIAPLMLVLVFAIIVYGSWFWMAQSLQMLASDAARVAIAGLSEDERQGLVHGYVRSAGSGAMGLDPEGIEVSVASDAESISVQLRYAASAHPLQAFAVMLPPPPEHIVRTAVVRTGGY
jgi:Flp pilus assembly protein TadG